MELTYKDGMRVLAITNLYPNPCQPHRAPYSRHQLRLLHVHCPVRVIAPIAWTDRLRRGHCPRRVMLDGLTVEHPVYWFPPKLARKSYGRWYRSSIRRAFNRALSDFRPTVIFSPWVYPDGWAAVHLGHAAKLPVVVQAHGSDIRLLDQHPGRLPGTVETLEQADGLIAVSRELAERMTALGAPPDRLRVIYDGVDASVFHPGDRRRARAHLQLPADERLVLFIGNLVPVKGLAFLLEALTQITARLVIVGEGPLRGALAAQAKRLGLTDRVQFMGALPLEHLPAWYQAADLFVLPSLSEGVPNVLLEASACGTPWVASRVGGIPEIAPLGRSRLVEPGNVPALAAAMRDMLDCPPGESANTPRLRTQAVAELHRFLQDIQQHSVPREQP